MQPHVLNRNSRGFSLMEVLIAMALGLLVVAGAVTLMTKGMGATFVVSQRAQMQGDVRAAENMLVRDISMAGAGLPSGGVQLPTVGPSEPLYGCDQTKTCYVPAPLAVGGGAPGMNYPAAYMYWVIPGPQKGPIISPGQPATDIITVVYADNNFRLNDYNNVTFGANGTSATFALAPVLPPNLPPNPPPQAVNDPVAGLQRGDLVFFQNTKGMAVVEVTGPIAVAGNSYTVPFADKDVLGINQSGAAANNLKSISAGTQTVANRIWVITYYLDVQPDPSGNNGPGTPRLMRQVNGQAPVPLADNIVNLQFMYDTYDTNGNLVSDAPDAAGQSPNLIQKVNLRHLTARSSVQQGPGARAANGYQSVDLQSQISVRNMSFKDRYQ